MINLREYQKTNERLSDLLPWASLVAPGVILNKDGSLQRTLRFRGIDVESSTQSALVAKTARLNNALKRLASGWVIYVELNRQPCTQYLPQSQFPNVISALIDAERREQFSNTDDNFINHYYLTVQWMPETTTSQSLSQYLIKKPTKQINDNQALEYFISSTNRLFDLLADLFFEAHTLDDSAILTYLHSTISTKKHRIKPPEIPMYLDAFIADSPLLGGSTPKLGDQHLRIVSVLGFPGTTLPALFDRLNQLPFPYRWMSRFIALDKSDAEKELRIYRRRWFAKRKTLKNLLHETFTKSESALIDNTSIEKSKDIDEALHTLSNDQASYGYYTMTITLLNKNEKIVNEQSRQVERIINGLGFTTITESINSVEAWLSSIPGQAYANVRKPLINTLNLSHLIPFSAVWAGSERDEYLQAPPLMQVHTSSRTPFRLVTHIGDVAHQMILGPTGSGKSVLLNFMALQFLRYQNSQIFVFDKGGSFLASTLGTGGAYYELGLQTKNLTFQPLANIDQDDEKNWATEWLQMLLINEKVPITPHVKTCLWNAINALAEVPKPQRTLTGFCALLQDQSLRQAFSTYTLSGAFGLLLDADQEKKRDNYWQCYELSSLMQTPDIIAPVLSYLFHRLEKKFTGTPTLIVLDEAWLFLDHPLFAQKIREWLKSLRKKNVGVIFATQSISDVLNTTITASLLESCPSRIFLPNDRALESQTKENYQKLGLNERQIHLLATAKSKQQYYYQSTMGNRLFDLLLQPVALAFCATSTLEDKKMIWSLHQKNQKNADFLQAYLDYKGLSWASNLLKETLRENYD
jgi:type IV secretion system protein VirB4